MALFRKQRGETVTLAEAVARGLVSFEVRGVGPGVASQIDLVITRHVEDPLTVVVPRGTELVPERRQP